MVSKYDVFYVIATKGQINLTNILDSLNKTSKDYQNIFNHVLTLEKDHLIERNEAIKIIHNEKSKKLFELISFCINNKINYNLLFKKTMLQFIQKAAKKEIFSISAVRVHPQTFNFYSLALAKYGLLLILSRKPFECKLLKHNFFYELADFFKIKLNFYKTHNHSLLNEIKKELRLYRRTLRISPSIINRLTSKEEANFIYASLNLEGNPVTLPETQKLILEDIVPEKHKFAYIQEVANYKKAVDLMMLNSGSKVKLTLALILEYHKIAMAQINEAGIFRKQNVIIKLNPKFKTSDWKEINLKIERLLEKYDEFESKKRDLSEVISFAAYFHNEFQRIHPFIDGNSRISRLLMLHILRMHDLPVLDWPIGYFDIYLDLTKRSTKRDDESLKYFVEELVFTNLKRMNAEI